MVGHGKEARPSHVSFLGSAEKASGKKISDYQIPAPPPL